MRTLLVTSALTQVPLNYDRCICTLAGVPQIYGLLVLDNRHPGALPVALKWMTAGARRLGLSLVQNLLGPSMLRRHWAFRSRRKPLWRLATINSPIVESIIKDHSIDLVLNARTRFIYDNAILAAPRLGCINIHHGLLPDQRGRMCDLWALWKGNPAGFSVHKMTSRVDAGGIITTVRVSKGRERDYWAYLSRVTREESLVLPAVLADIERRDKITTVLNSPTDAKVYRRVPRLKTLNQMARDGMRI